jgi:1-acyl-sn-glycerol-3-phosphate acyltransferase
MGVKARVISSGVRVLLRILCIAPEDTGSADDILKRGKSGPAAIAMRAKVPVYPVALYGAEQFWKNFKRLRCTPITIKVGTPFIIRETQEMGRKATLQEVSEQIMMQIASLMSPGISGRVQR